jgi:hypothetical protein
MMMSFRKVEEYTNLYNIQYSELRCMAMSQRRAEEQMCYHSTYDDKFKKS